ncbi:MAG TPA: hypothetical protein VIM11_23125 [Tepidisphaeraceae bacterium]|jgi:tetratricopeptide (TPR) repeat protein
MGLSSKLIVLALLALLPGCVSQAQRDADEGVAAYYMGDYPRAIQLIKPAAAKTNENFVLNNDRLAMAALAAYDLTTAENAFVRSYEVINSVGVNDGGRSLGAALVSENIKVWKGEPFERAMVNFYLGVIYYMRHDYGNARGAFENALFKLRDYGEQSDKNDQYHDVESNFVLAYLMLARSYQQLGRTDLAQKNFDRVTALRPDLAALADVSINAEANLVLIIDFGRGPQKEANGDGAFVGFRPTPREQGPIPLPAVTVDGRRQDLQNRIRPPVDLLAIAQDRRWESIDTIRAVKSVLGTGLIAAGIADAAIRRRPDPAVSLGLIAGGLILKATSQGDLRQWEMLPRTVFVVPVHVPPGKHDVTVEFPALPGYRQRWLGIDVPEKGDAAYYIHIDRYNSGPFQWPPAAVPPAGKVVG